MRLVASILLVSSGVPCSSLEQRGLRSDALRAGFLRQNPASNDDADQGEIAALKAQVASLKLQQAEWNAGPYGKEEANLTEQHTVDEQKMKTLREELAHEEKALVDTQKEMQTRTVELDVRDQEVKTLEAEVTNLTVPAAKNSSSPGDASSNTSNEAPALDSNFSRNMSSNMSFAVADNATNNTSNLKAVPAVNTAAPEEVNTVNATLVAEVAELQAVANAARVDAAVERENAALEREKNRDLKKLQKALWNKTTKLFSKVNATLRRTLHQLGEEKAKSKQIQAEGLEYFNEVKTLQHEKQQLQKAAVSLRADKSEMILTMRGVLAQNSQYQKETESDKDELKEQAQDFEKREKRYKAEIARYAAHTPIRDIVDDYKAKALDDEHARTVRTKKIPQAASLPAVSKVTTPAASSQKAVAPEKEAARSSSAPLATSRQSSTAVKKVQDEDEEPAADMDEDEDEAPAADMEELSDLSKLEVGIDKAKRDLDLDA